MSAPPAFIRIHNGFKGWVRSDFPPESIAAILEQFDDRSRTESSRWLKDEGKSRVVQRVFEDASGKSWDLVIKRVRYGPFIRRLGFLFLASPAYRALKGALLLQERGIPTAPPLAAVETGRWQGLGTSYYFAETVQNGRTLYRAWRELRQKLPPAMAKLKQRRLLAALSVFVRRVHASGIYHRDMKGTNILVRDPEAEALEFVLVDVDGVRRSRVLTERQRINNLIQICRFHGLSDRDRLWFLREYCKGGNIPRQTVKSLAKRILPLVQAQSLAASRPGRGKKVI